MNSLDECVENIASRIISAPSIFGSEVVENFANEEVLDKVKELLYDLDVNSLLYLGLNIDNWSDNTVLEAISNMGFFNDEISNGVDIEKIINARPSALNNNGLFKRAEEERPEDK